MVRCPFVFRSCRCCFCFIVLVNIAMRVIVLVLIVTAMKMLKTALQLCDSTLTLVISMKSFGSGGLGSNPTFCYAES